MKFDLQYDIFDCITELNRIAEELKAAALDIQRSIVGIDTQKTVKGLNDAIELQEIEIPEDNAEYAVAHTVVTAEILGEQYVRKAEFELVYYIDRWCIARFCII